MGTRFKVHGSTSNWRATVHVCGLSGCCLSLSSLSVLDTVARPDVDGRTKTKMDRPIFWGSRTEQLKSRGEKRRGCLSPCCCVCLCMHAQSDCAHELVYVAEQREPPGCFACCLHVFQVGEKWEREQEKTRVHPFLS